MLRPRPLDLPAFQSNGFRPKSAATARSCKSIRAMSSRRLSRKDLAKPRTSVVFERVSDRDGVCLFDGLTLDVYEVEVEESKDYHSASKVVDTLQERDKSEFKVFIGLRPQNNCDFSVVLRDALIRSEVSQAKVVLQKNGTEHYLRETRKGVYEVSLPKDFYELTVIANKYKEITKNISANQAEVLITETLELKKTRAVSVKVFDLLEGFPLSGVILEVLINQQSFSGLTRNGVFSFNLEETGLLTVKAQVKGYAKMKVLMQMNTEQNSVTLAMLALSTANPVVVISWPRCPEDLEVVGTTEIGRAHV